MLHPCSRSTMFAAKQFGIRLKLAVRLRFRWFSKLLLRPRPLAISAIVCAVFSALIVVAFATHPLPLLNLRQRNGDLSSLCTGCALSGSTVRLTADSDPGTCDGSAIYTMEIELRQTQQAFTNVATHSVQVFGKPNCVLMAYPEIVVTNLATGAYKWQARELTSTGGAGTWDSFNGGNTAFTVGGLNAARHQHTATLLQNGKVLVAGGLVDNTLGTALSSAELYDPATGTWSFTSNLSSPRVLHTATRLPNGKVLVAGGYTGGNTNTAELYDPASGTWSNTGNLNVGRHSHTATLLANGKVLVAGGQSGNDNLASAELYDPATGMWSGTGSLNLGRREYTAVLLQNGKVLVAGGLITGGFTNSAELYDPATGTWSNTGSLSGVRRFNTLMLLNNGKVLLAGGHNDSVVFNDSHLYDPATGTWSATGNLVQARYVHTASLLPNGKVLITSGNKGDYNSSGDYLNSSELYDPASGTWTQYAALGLNVARGWHTATTLLSGQVLVAGGYLNTGLNSTELLDCPTPVINIHPVNQAVCAGATVQFSVSTTNTGFSLSYQWRKNGVALSNGGRISGATTPQLAISNATATDAGAYDVVVTSTCQTTTSNAATLAPQSTVTVSAATATYSSNNQSVTLNATLTSNAGAVNSGSVTFTLKNGATVIGTANSGAVSNGSATANYTLPGGTPTGTYTIEARYNGACTGYGYSTLKVAMVAGNECPTLSSNDFTLVSGVTAGTNPRAVAVADFNNDGKRDLAVPNAGSGTVSVLLDNGDGTFQAKLDASLGAGTQPEALAVGYFNADNNVDLAVAKRGSSQVAVLLGNGNGTFGAVTDYPVGTAPFAVAIGDFNGDFMSDLVTANHDSGNVTVRFGNGAGGFPSSSLFNAGSQPSAVAVGDFNVDGKADLAVANFASNTVSIFLGYGNGNFTLLTNLTAGTSPRNLALGYFNSDSYLDLAVANSNGTTLSLFLGNGDGSFSSAGSVNLSGAPHAVAAGDVNGDGKTDLTATLSTNKLAVALGDGAGGFGAVTLINQGASPVGVAVSDLNGDGRSDLIEANTDSTEVAVLLNSCACAAPQLSYGSWAIKPSGTLTFSPTQASGNITGYSVQAYGGLSMSTLSVSPVGKVTVSNVPGAAGTTYTPTIRGTTSCGSMADASFTLRVFDCATLAIAPATLPDGTVGLGYSQALTGNTNPPHIFTLSGGALPTGLSLNTSGIVSGVPQTSGTFNFTIRVEDANGCVKHQAFTLSIGGNSNCPAITLPSEIERAFIGQAYSQVLSAAPAGVYNYSSTLNESGFVFSCASNCASLTLSNANVSGLVRNIDFALTATQTATANCFGSTTYRLKIRAPLAAQALLADYDGDAASDYVVWSASTGEWRILNSRGNQAVQWGTAGDVPLLGDYDGDGKTDLAVFRPSNGTWYVKQSRTGQFLIKHWGLDTDIPVPGDYDGDGKTDIAVWRPSEGNWYVWRSRTQQSEITRWGAGYAPYDDVPVAGDYDGDGASDLAVFRRGSGAWYVRQSGTAATLVRHWGLATDVPVPQDYDGDGKTDLAVWRGATGQWYVLRSRDNSFSTTAWGLASAPYNDQPAPGDYDDDGKTDLAVWRAADSTWYILRSDNGAAKLQRLGAAGDRPVTAGQR